MPLTARVSLLCLCGPAKAPERQVAGVTAKAVVFEEPTPEHTTLRLTTFRPTHAAQSYVAPAAHTRTHSHVFGSPILRSGQINVI